MAELSAAQRFEDAQVVRDRLVALVRGATRSQRLDPLARIPELVAARRAVTGGWEVVCVRHGRLAGSTTSPRGADPMPYVAALCASAEVVGAPLAPATAATPEESEKVLRWLEAPGTRIVVGRRRVDLPGRRGGRGPRGARAARDLPPPHAPASPASADAAAPAHGGRHRAVPVVAGDDPGLRTQTVRNPS